MLEELARQRGFSLDRLITLARVARFPSIAAAAKHQARDDRDVAVRQTLYGRQIRELSEACGVALMDTSRRPHSLTVAGKELARIANHFLRGMDDYLARLQSRSTKVVFGAGESMIQWVLLPEVLPELRRRLPHAPLVLKNLRTRQITQGLLEGELDFGLLREDAISPPLHCGPLFAFDYRYFIPRSFRARIGDPVSLTEMARYPLGILEGDGEIRIALERALGNAGLPVRFALECSSYPQIARAVERRECAGILPSLARPHLPDYVRDLSIDDVDLHRRFRLAWNPDRVEMSPLLRFAITLFPGQDG